VTRDRIENFPTTVIDRLEQTVVVVEVTVAGQWTRLEGEVDGGTKWLWVRSGEEEELPSLQ
tara:strand:- start:161 stop:343 length:183 start_codon:yes stop_codon:yes gene_type:complete